MTLKKKALENTVLKGENAGNHHFFVFPHILVTIHLSSVNAFNLVTSKILSFGKELKCKGFCMKVAWKKNKTSP